MYNIKEKKCENLRYLYEKIIYTIPIYKHQCQALISGSNWCHVKNIDLGLWAYDRYK